MPMSWAQALGWRMRRHLLDPVSTGTVRDVVEHLGSIPAWPDTTTELAIGARRTDGRNGDAARALAAGEVVKVFTYRGGTHLMTPQDAGATLALRASGRMWELPSWQSYYELAPGDWPRFREYVAGVLTDGPLTLAELIAGLRRSSRYRRIADILAEGNETILKPLSWQGVLGLGPARDGKPTFLRLEDVPGWAGIPDLDEAGPAVVEGYLRIHGPASVDRIREYVGKGLGVKPKPLTHWLEQVRQRCEEVTVEGDHVLVLAEDLDELKATRASSAVRLLPARDPWVMAPGTDDTRVVPTARRELVSRSANLVIAGGRLAGTWAVRGEELEVTWFEEAGRAPRAALEEQVAELARFLRRALDVRITTG